ncbi:MAG: SAM-dependent methyltransferase [Deltaproteobacteria bacterium]|nr:SAM-dependent methyltransferase [Deltaproteobacteria bacterium]
MLEQEWNPGLLLKVSGSYWQTCALHTSVKLDLFTIIGKATLSGKAIAEKAGLDEMALARLLDALAAMQLLVKEDGHYKNTSAAVKFLSKKSKSYIGHMINHHHHLMDSWTRMAESLKTGQPNRRRASYSEEEERESFLMGMFVIGMHTAPTLAGEIDLSGRRTLIDIGGGPGTFAIHFCLKNPELKATVYDLPTTRPFAEKTIKKFGLADRINFLDGNYVEEDIEGAYDAAWLSHILHGEGPETCLEILKKTVSVLVPGGIICIHDFILHDTMDGPLFPTLFSINMLLGTESGRSYSETQLMDMLEKAGVKEARRLSYVGPTESGVIVGQTKS